MKTKICILIFILSILSGCGKKIYSVETLKKDEKLREKIQEECKKMSYEDNWKSENCFRAAKANSELLNERKMELMKLIKKKWSVETLEKDEKLRKNILEGCEEIPFTSNENCLIAHQISEEIKYTRDLELMEEELKKNNEKLNMQK